MDTNTKTGTGTVATEIRRKTAKEKIANRVARQPRLLDEVFENLEAKEPDIRFGSDKVLRVLSAEHPGALYPRIDEIVERLDSESNVLRWGAVAALGNLAAVDDDDRIDAVLDRYFTGIKGPDLVAATNIAKGAANIAAAKPHLADDIATRVLQIEKGKYKTEECKNVALGAAVEALQSCIAAAGRPKRIVNFVRRQIDNPRPSTRKKAERFLKKWA